MAAIATAIDCMAAFLGNQDISTVGNKDNVKNTIRMMYIGFTFMWLLTLGLYSDSDFSAVMTGGTTLQALGWLILCAEVRSTKSVQGLSSQSLQLFIVFYVLRLTATTLKNGYIPVDASGDFMMQGFDGLSLLCVLHLIYLTHRDYQHSYQEEHDTFPIMPMLVPALILGYFIHGDFNKNVFFDGVWAASLNVETLTLIPQLWMMAKIGGTVSNATSHWIFCQVMSCVCRFTFWWWAYEEQTTQISGYHIITNHVLQLLFCADFMFYYVQSVINGASEVELPDSI